VSEVPASASGRTVLVTRPEESSDPLAALLRERGVRVIEAPTVEIRSLEDTSRLDEAVASLAAGEFEWVVFASPRAVVEVARRLEALALELPPTQQVGVVGPATGAALEDIGATAALSATPHTTEALGAAFPRGSRGRVLLPRADIAPEGLEHVLDEKGWNPVRIDAYRTVYCERLPEEAERALRSREVDVVAFTSASTVEGFARVVDVAVSPPAVCMGPVTAHAARRTGFEVAGVADPHTIEGLVEALSRTLGRR
jgi:uroporphyrinogen-III synthase